MWGRFKINADISRKEFPNLPAHHSAKYPSTQDTQHHSTTALPHPGEKKKKREREQRNKGRIKEYRDERNKGVDAAHAPSSHKQRNAESQERELYRWVQQ
jgi:hypothetical protein